MSRLRFKRCIRRYHRALFIWYLSKVLNNIMVLFKLLFANAEELERAKEASNIGYKQWFQNELGNGLIEEGIRIARIDKREKSAGVVTKFWRLAVAKTRVFKMRESASATQVTLIYHRSHLSISVSPFTPHPSPLTLHPHPSPLTGCQTTFKSAKSAFGMQ